MATKAHKVVQPEATQQKIQVSLLDFDAQNPRFPSEIASGPADELIERFVRDERLLEVIESIANQGYFAGEPLLVVPHKKRFIVLEGNRRLAALKLLTKELEAPEGRISIEKAVEEAKFRPTSVPCLVFDDRKAILKYLGFRHITGIKSWSALQKARYVKRLRDESYSDLGYEQSLKLLARETGSKAPYVGLMLTALALYQAAEEENFYELGLSVDDIDFSIISTALGYANISDWLGLKSRTDAEQAGLKTKRLSLFFKWAFLKGENSRSVLRDSRNLKKLAAIVASPDAVKELTRNNRLDDAYELSKGPAIALLEALTTAERRMTAVWGLLRLISSADSSHLERANSIFKLAKDVRLQLMAQALEEEDDA
ncbi:hypothetical protein NB697_003629 [Xanthomonas sacchari]|uniref:ParB/RepB/Spo0J family partition protein n=1 Tax=Xanthomonas sacchari TaxID=56458 RepID=UPI0022546EB5|nr:ParB/RepB/Spo0J family partition protein [Xanthomonas sacchari]MCW0380783.1 hypothetical protein [Xanthomonas sacchari]